MKTTKLVRFALLALSLVLLLSSAAIAEEERYPGANTIDAKTKEMTDRYEANAPKVITLENGVKIQRTPSDANAYWQFWHAPISAAARPVTATLSPCWTTCSSPT